MNTSGSAVGNTNSDIYAGIDIGTLTFRLLVARITADGQLQELHSERRIVRLGEGLPRTGSLQATPMERGLETLRSWMPVIGRTGAKHVTAVATSAVRDAVNRVEFLSAVKQATGLDVEVITGQEEARRSLLGIRAGLPAGMTRFVALDIGGGSTEFIKVSPGNAPIVYSVDEGVVRLTEDCLSHDPPSTEEIARATARVQGHLQDVNQALGDVEGYQLIGTAGTITTLAAMDQRLEAYAPLRIHNYMLSFDHVCRLSHDIISRTAAERRVLQGLEPGREEVILAGTLLLQQVMDFFHFSECLVSDYGLREGVLIDLWRKTVPAMS